MRSAFSSAALAAVLSLCMATSADAQGFGPTPSAAAGGRPGAIENAPLQQSVAIGGVNPSMSFANASFATGAVGLRNRGDGGIEVSGVTGPIKRALLYWAVITYGPPTAAVASVYLKKGGANGPFTNIVGARIATGQTPCWFAGDRITVYRAVVPTTLANGNGLYIVLLKPGANGSRAGQSPWVNSTIPPLFEGISLVIIGSGNARVSVYDVGFAGRMFYDTLTYQLRTASIAGATQVVFHNIGADGQIGVDVTALPAASGEITFLNNRRIAGPGSAAQKSDWNGSVAEPLPQLWDNTTHVVTSQALAGSPTLLPFRVSAPDDCLVTVANILSVR